MFFLFLTADFTLIGAAILLLASSKWVPGLPMLGSAVLLSLFQANVYKPTEEGEEKKRKFWEDCLDYSNCADCVDCEGSCKDCGLPHPHLPDCHIPDCHIPDCGCGPDCG
jgi:hypothetical protein